MTTSIAIAFPWGMYHANPWGRHVNEAVVEWPPSPWRILRALYSVWKCREPGLDASVVEALLGKLADPPAYILPPSMEAHTRHYYPDSRYGTDKAIDAFAVMECDAEIGVTWAGDLDEVERRMLGSLIGSLPYLGRAESVCEGRLLSEGEGIPGEPCIPLEDGAVAEGLLERVLVPTVPLDLMALTARTTTVRSAGYVDPPGTRWQSYQLPSPPRSLTVPHRRAPAVQRPTAVRWAIASTAPPPVTAAVGVADILRSACMSKFGSPPSPLLAGKDEVGERLRDHRHAHYLAVDEDGDRRLDHLYVWVPDGLGQSELMALANVVLLGNGRRAQGWQPVRLGLEGVGQVKDVAPRLVGPARRWSSHTPFASPRHAKQKQSLSDHIETQVREELTRRHLPDPRWVGVMGQCPVGRGEDGPVNSAAGGGGDRYRYRARDSLSYRRHRIQERLTDARPATAVELLFDEPVLGPIAVGALSHFGLGLFLPCNGHSPWTVLGPL